MCEEYSVFPWESVSSCRLRCAVARRACCLALGHHSCPVSLNLMDHSKRCVRSSRILVRLTALIKNWTNISLTTWDMAQKVEGLEWEFLETRVQIRETDPSCCATCMTFCPFHEQSYSFNDVLVFPPLLPIIIIILISLHHHLHLHLYDYW